MRNWASQSYYAVKLTMLGFSVDNKSGRISHLLNMLSQYSKTLWLHLVSLYKLQGTLIEDVPVIVKRCIYNPSSYLSQ